MTLKEMLIKHEGKRYKPYRCTKGKRTIGIGHNIDANGLPADIQAYLTQYGCITDTMVDILYEFDVKAAIDDCLRLYPGFEGFTHARKKALIDFLFNLGYDRARKFKNANAAINEERWQAAGENMKQSLWFTQVGDRAKEIIELLINGHDWENPISDETIRKFMQ